MKQFLLVVTLLVATAGFAKIPKPIKNTYVNDFAGVLSTAQVRALNVKIHRIERLTTVQMAVVLVDKLPEEYEIEDFALLIGRKWHVGKNKNGLVYVAAIKQHKQRLEVARLLTSKVTESNSQDILNVTKTYFKQQDYNGGLQAMVDKISTKLIPAPVNATPLVSTNQQEPKPEDNLLSQVLAVILGLTVLVGIPALIVIWIIRAVKRRNNYRMSQNYSNYNNINNGNSPIGYGQPMGPNYNGNAPSSHGRTGAALGGFAVGAAAGYAARTIQDHWTDNNSHHNTNLSSNGSIADTDSSSYNTASSDQDSSNWGNWGSGSDSSSSDSSSDSGFDGDSGSTSDW